MMESMEDDGVIDACIERSEELLGDENGWAMLEEDAVGRKEEEEAVLWQRMKVWMTRGTKDDELTRSCCI